jgi:hypothetical protein
MNPTPQPTQAPTRSKPNIELHSRRDFINLPFCYSDGSITSMIYGFQEEKTNEVGETVNKIDFNISLKIRDCERAINLAFSLNDDPDSYSNCLFKIDTIVNHLQELRMQIQKAEVVRIKGGIDG